MPAWPRFPAIASPRSARPLPAKPEFTSVVRLLGLSCALGLGLTTGAASAAWAGQRQPIDFSVEVMAVLTKAGCNQGACHGNQQGKGGLKLSLRGEDAQWDYQQLLRAHGGRRVNLLEPDNSLLLQKPAGRLAHEGGVRFRRASREYQLLREWIETGAPRGGRGPQLEELTLNHRGLVVLPPDQSTLALQATARFSDGSRRDVTRLTVFETTNLLARVEQDGLLHREGSGETTVIARFLNQQAAVSVALLDRPAATGARPHTASGRGSRLDQLVQAKWELLGLTPAPPASDEVFVRRVYLDALGILPTADEARTFVRDPAADKHARLVDRVLARPELAEHWGLKWSDLLRNEEKVLDARGVDTFSGWIRKQLSRNTPWDQFVRQLLTAQGSTYQNPPANFYRAHRTPVVRSETIARLFLGVRLQCAQCHNHPFDRWTQDDYYSWAAQFRGIDYKIVDNQRRDKFDKNEFVGEQIVEHQRDQQVLHPRTGAAATARFLGEASDPQPDVGSRLEQVAGWITAHERFAETQANWIWYHVMGRGLVEPVDDFRPTNPPSNPDLLAHLADYFRQHDYQFKELLRYILTSRTYRLAAERPEGRPASELEVRNLSRADVRRLTAEQLLDAQSAVLGVPAQFSGFPAGMRAGQLPGVRRVSARRQPLGAGDRFLVTFGKPTRLLACECERSNETTLAQAFLMIGGEGLHARLTADDNQLAQWARSPRPAAELVSELYWAALSRAPTPVEQQAAVKLIREAPNRLLGLQDVAWAVLNAKEFIFRH